MANYRNAGTRWSWTDERKRCLSLHVKGIPKNVIARKLARSVNTITNWTMHPLYQLAFNKRLAEHTRSGGLRRRYQTGKLLVAVDARYALLLKEFRKLQRNDSPRTMMKRQMVVSQLGIIHRQWDRLCTQQRNDEGESVKQLLEATGSFSQRVA